MTREEQLAYQRGYNAGSRSAWPAHKPPRPPDETVAGLMDAGTKLRNIIDGFLATIDPDEELQESLGQGIDVWDEAMEAVGVWLKGGDS